MKLLFVLFISIQVCIAEDVKVVKKGDIVPFDGVLFTKELEKSIRMDMQISEKKIDTLSKLNDLNEKEIEVLLKRVELNREAVKEMADKEVSSENSAFWKHTLYFISGALITGLISYGVNR